MNLLPDLAPKSVFVYHEATREGRLSTGVVDNKRFGIVSVRSVARLTDGEAEYKIFKSWRGGVVVVAVVRPLYE